MENYNVLRIPSCLGENTRILTKQGVRFISNLEKEKFEVIDGNGNWAEATLTFSGVEEVIRITATKSNGSAHYIYAGLGQGWYIQDLSELQPFQTHNLKPGDVFVNLTNNTSLFKMFLRSMKDFALKPDWTVSSVRRDGIHKQRTYKINLPTSNSFALIHGIKAAAN